MAVYIVSYDLNSPGQDYEALYDELKRPPAGWIPIMDSTWLIDSAESAQSLSDRIRQHLDENDWLFVAEITTNHQGWLPQVKWDWVDTAFGR